jgi:CHAT domain-containing protein
MVRDQEGCLRWVKSDLGTASLQREVAALRCGLDYEGSWTVADSACLSPIKATFTFEDHRANKPLPFDLSRAYSLYKGLFGEVDQIIKGKQLLIVPSAALTQLPFQVLVTAAPDPKLKDRAALRAARWLIRDHAITMLPSVSALIALRERARVSRASKAMIGFGNPLLDGPQDDPSRAEMARKNTTCPVKVASLPGIGKGIAPVDLRVGQADIGQILRAPALPETADELCAVARYLGAPANDIYLGDRATIPVVEKLSDEGELAKYRLIHFATHGALSGQLRGTSEPGLILTPPNTATDADDGYLSASRIAGLKLDADWVILSACNTAAGEAKDAEALPGLAKAFFYAGARALLVTHWSVDSNAAVKLIVRSVSRMSKDKHIGRAEALRQSMLALIRNGSDFEARPSTWAPFVVVGEGAAPNN